MFNHILKYFKFPQILFTFPVFFIFLYLSSFIPSVEVFYFCIGTFIFLSILYLHFTEHRSLRKLSSLYFESTQYQCLNRNIILMFYFILISPTFFSDKILMTYPIVFSFNLTAMVLLFLVYRVLLHNLKNTIFKKTLVSFD